MVDIGLIIILYIFGTVGAIQLVLFDDWSHAFNICTIAINEAKTNGDCTSKMIDVINRPGCGENHFQSASYAISAIASTQEPFDYVFVGPTCAADIRTIADFAGIWKTPVIGYSQYPEIDYSPTDTHSMINIVKYSISGIVGSLEILLKELKQVEITLVGPISSETDQDSMSLSIREYNLKTNKLNIANFVEFQEKDENWPKTLNLVQSTTRTIVICMDFLDLHTALYNLDVKKLTGFRFLIILVINKPPEEIFHESKTKSILDGTSIFIVGPSNPNFEHNLELMVESIPNVEQNDYTQFLDIYNACYAYCVGSINGAESTVTDYHKIMNEKTVKNKYGSFTFEENGEVLSDYAVYTLSAKGNLFENLMVFNSTPKACDELTCYSLKNIDPELKMEMNDKNSNDAPLKTGVWGHS